MHRERSDIFSPFYNKFGTVISPKTDTNHNHNFRKNKTKQKTYQVDSEIDETYLNFKMTLNRIFSVICVEKMAECTFGLR